MNKLFCIKDRKYNILIDDTIKRDGKTLYRIVCVKDIGHAKIGERGGYIQKEENLSHEGKCWIFNNSICIDDAKIIDDAIVTGNCLVAENSVVKNKAWVSGRCEILGYASINDSSYISGDCIIADNVVISGKSRVYGKSLLTGEKKYHNIVVLGTDHKDLKIETEVDTTLTTRFYNITN